MKKIIIILFATILATGIFIKQQMDDPYRPSDKQLISEHNTLVLVNKDTKYKEEPYELVQVRPDLATNLTVKDGEYLIDEQVLGPLTAMLKAAKREEIHNFILNSAYRSYEKQQAIYKETGSKYALPAGYSEHETGLALDIGSTTGLMESSEEGKWLASNAHKFGFILRYPQHKLDITQIAFEPWHFRYVGLPHSEIMFENDFVLEEYLSWIKQKQSITKKINGIKYMVKYVEEYDTHVQDKDGVIVNSFGKNGFITTTIVN